MNARHPSYGRITPRSSVSCGGIKANTANQKNGRRHRFRKINALYQTSAPTGSTSPKIRPRVVFCDYRRGGKCSASNLPPCPTPAKSRDDCQRRAARSGHPVLGVKWYPSVGVKKAQATGIRHGTGSNTSVARFYETRSVETALETARQVRDDSRRVRDLTELVRRCGWASAISILTRSCSISGSLKVNLIAVLKTVSDATTRACLNMRDVGSAMVAHGLSVERSNRGNANETQKIKDIASAVLTAFTMIVFQLFVAFGIPINAAARGMLGATAQFDHLQRRWLAASMPNGKILSSTR